MSSITDLKLHITTVEHYHDISKAVFCRNFSDYIFALSKTHLYRQQPDFTVDLIQAIGRFLCIVLHIFIKEPSPPFSGKHFFASLASREVLIQFSFLILGRGAGVIIFFLTKNYHVLEKFLTERIILRWGWGGGRGVTEMHARNVLSHYHFKAA